MNPQHSPLLFKVGRCVADDLENISTETGKPQFVECGCCDSLHPASFNGDCRDDDNRFDVSMLDERYGLDGWEEFSEEDE